MAAPHKPIIIALIAVFLMAAPPIEAYLSCNTVFGAFFDCRGAVATCCGGVQEIYRVSTADDRQRVCICLKAYYSAFTVSTIARINDFRPTCNVNVPFITRTVDCTTVT